MKWIKSFTLTLIIIVNSYEDSYGQDRISIIPKFGQYQETESLLVESVDGVIIEPDRTSSNMEYVIGLGLNYAFNSKISFSLSFENAFLFGSSYTFYDSQDPTQFGFVQKGMGVFFDNVFVSGSVSYDLISVNDWRISVSAGPEVLFNSLRGDSEFDFGRQHERLNEVAGLIVSSFKPSLFHLRLGTTLHYKRLQFSVVLKEDFNTSGSNNINYEGQSYQFINDRKLVFFTLGYEVFKF
jgi:hypothetical protein